MSGEIIDLNEYLRKKQQEEEPVRTTFAVWGGDGERSRFALPLWRAAYLGRVTRAALAWERVGEVPDLLEPFVVLDLGQDPARTDIDGTVVEPLRGDVTAPAMHIEDREGGMYLGERLGRRWYLVLLDPRETDDQTRAQEDIYFLAGECAGLLFHRRMDEEVED